MQSLIDFIVAHAPHAHWIIFGSLLLAGLNIPISEDLLIVTSAILASNIVPENTIQLFAAVFLGCYLSDWIVYWTGRLLGDKLFEIKWFQKKSHKKKIQKVRIFYKKYGIYTLLVGRFIPFGVRNCLFLTAGMTKMKFKKFMLGDGIACAASNSVLFFTAYTLGKNYQSIFKELKVFHVLIFLVFVVTLIFGIWYYLKKRKK